MQNQCFNKLQQLSRKEKHLPGNLAVSFPLYFSSMNILPAKEAWHTFSQLDLPTQAYYRINFCFYHRTVVEKTCLKVKMS